MARAASALKQTDAAKAVAPKSPPPALDSLNGARVHPNDVLLVDLDDIIVSTMNPRHDQPAEDVEELAANIERFGLLHPLIGHRDGDKYAAIGGRRRRAALQLLADRGQWPKGESGRVKFTLIEDFDDAPGVVLSEDLMKVAMNPADEARTFAKMADCTTRPGMERAAVIDHIARAFGRSAKFVEGRLRLANLHPPILDALSRNQITIETAQAYGRAPSSESEEAAWKKFGVDGHASQIRRHFEQGALRGNDRLCKFVGEEAYLAAGGQISRDLFSDREDALWLNPDIVQRLADEKLETEKQRVAAEGWADVKAFVEDPWSISTGYTDQTLGKKRKPTDAEKIELEAIKKRGAEIEQAQDALSESDAYDADKADALEQEENELADRRARIEAGLIEYKPAERAASGAVLVIDEDGALNVKRAVVLPKAAKGAASTGKTAERGSAAKPAAPDQPPMTALAHARLTKAAGEIVGRAMIARQEIALVAVAAWLARCVFSHSTTDAEPLAFRASGYEPGRPDLKGGDVKLTSDKDHAKQRAFWKERLAPHWKTAGAVETYLADLPPGDVIHLIALCVGDHMHTTEQHAERPHKTMRKRLAVLGALAGASPFDEFAPDEDLFKAMRRDELNAAAKLIGIDAPDKKTKGALAAMCADKAEAARWVHPVMAEMCGASAKPAAPPAPKKAAKKAPPEKKPAAKKPAPKKAVRK